MLRKLIIIILIILNLNYIYSFADEEDIEGFMQEDIWEEIKEVSSKENKNIPVLNSKSAIIFDRTSKKIIFEKNANEKRAMASTTKIMTAILTIEKGNLEEIVEVSQKAASIHGSRLGLKKGDKIKLEDLLYGLLLKSGNDAAMQIAISISGSIENFAEMMNEKAEELGLKNTHFVTPHGLDNSNHYTTAYELAILTDYALNIPEFAKIVNTKQYTIQINSTPVLITNTNELLGNLNGVNGVKTGFTNLAGRCLVTSCVRDNWQIITIVLGADSKKSRTKDSISLIEYNYKNFTRINIKERIKKVFADWKESNEKNIDIIKGKKCNIETDMNYTYDFELYPVHKEEEKNITIQIECKDKLEAPIKDKLEIGKIHVIHDSKEIMSIPIITKGKIEKKSVLDYFIYLIGKQFWIIQNA